jgi:hypothetical protein
MNIVVCYASGATKGQTNRRECVFGDDWPPPSPSTSTTRSALNSGMFWVLSGNGLRSSRQRSWRRGQSKGALSVLKVAIPILILASLVTLTSKDLYLLNAKCPARNRDENLAQTARMEQNAQLRPREYFVLARTSVVTYLRTSCVSCHQHQYGPRSCTNRFLLQ